MCLGVPGITRERWQEADGQTLARADFGGEEKTIRLNYLPDLLPGDWVITHAGFALTRLTPDDAAETLRTMRDVGLLPELEETWMTANIGTPLTTIAECHEEVCITCSDQGIVAEIVEVPSTPLDLARVSTPDGEEEVDVTLVGLLAVGDRILVHGGVALTKLDPVDVVASGANQQLSPEGVAR